MTYITIEYAVTTTIVTNIIGNPTLKKRLNEIGYPASSAIPAVTTFAEAPMIVPLPPRHAPKESAQARGANAKPNSGSDAIPITTGTIVAV